MNGTRGLKRLVMDEALAKLIGMAMDRRGIPVAARPDAIDRLRHHPDYRTIVEQYRLNASDRAMIGLIDRALIM